MKQETNNLYDVSFTFKGSHLLRMSASSPKDAEEQAIEQFKRNVDNFKNNYEDYLTWDVKSIELFE